MTRKSLHSMAQGRDGGEVVLSDKETADRIYKAVKRGEMRKIASKLYTTNLDEALEDIVRRNVWQIVSLYLPDAVVADRTAFLLRPTEDGSVFVVSSKQKKILLPGVTIRSRKGRGAIPDDREFISGIRLSSPARAFLENLRPSRSRNSAASRTLSRRELEEELEKVLQNGGEARLLEIRDGSRRIARELQLETEAEVLDRIIGTLLGARDSILRAPIAVARSKGLSYDQARVQTFEDLFLEIERTSPIHRPVPEFGNLEALPFYEAYFSNFIEGTEFEVEEAEQIIFDGELPEARPDDAHDILGTYRVVSDSNEMTRIANSFSEFLEILKERHKTVMHSRKDRKPGEFKDRENRAGGTVFVSPDLVEGTLLQGYQIYRKLSHPFGRAIFLMFILTEVHPFLDGNGRVARIMMNAELSSAREFRIIIPTVYRDNYLSGLRAVTQHSRSEALLSILDFAQRYTAAVDWSSRKGARRMLEETGAFMGSREAEDRGVRLKLPTA